MVEVVIKYLQNDNNYLKEVSDKIYKERDDLDFIDYG